MTSRRPAVIALILIAAATGAPLEARAQAPQFITSWGSYGAGNGQFSSPVGVAVDPAGNVYVIDADNDCVQKFTSDGAFLARWGSQGTAAGQLQLPQGVACDLNGDIFVAEGRNSRVQEFSSDGAYIRMWGLPNGGSPRTVAVDPTGQVLVADAALNRVVRFTNSGDLISFWNTSAPGIGAFWPDGLGVGPDGSVYVVARDLAKVVKNTGSGGFLELWSIPPAIVYALPLRVAAATDGRVYVTDGNNCRILVYDTDGVLLTQWGSCGAGLGQFAEPIGIAVDANGNVYVADKNNFRIQKYGPVPTPTATASWGSVKTRYR